MQRHYYQSSLELQLDVELAGEVDVPLPLLSACGMQLC